MNAQSRFLPFALLVAVLAAPVALADRDHRRDRDDDRWRGRHEHSERCYHGPGPQPAPQPGPGRYELRTVDVRVPGFMERVWVPEVCREKRHGRVKCRGGYYEERWVEGYTERREQWVWVPAPTWHRAPAGYPVPPAPGRPGFSVRVGVDL